MADLIRTKLQQGFHPEQLEVIDDSALHQGHAGASAGGESHFTVKIVSAAFQGVSRVQRQRQIHDVLAEELRGPVHALSVKALAPGET